MVKRLSLAALAAAFVGSAVVAAAQEGTMHRPVGLSLRAGVFFPVDTNTRAGGTGWLSFGMDYKFTEHMDMDSRDVLSISLDYAARNNFRTVPLLVNYTRHNGPVYFLGGLGASFTRRPVGAGIEDKTQLAYQFGVGYEFQTSEFPLFVEGRFLGNGRPELNGFVVSVGARF